MRSSRQAFTLVEVLVVVVIIAALAAIAIPRYTRSKSNAHVAAMKSDLRNLMTAQEAYRGDSSTYAPSLSSLTAFRTTDGVGIVIDEASQASWHATATHVATSRTCSVRLGVGERDVEPLCD